MFLHPSSALYFRQPEYLVYDEVTITTKEYMRACTAINPKWLTELAPGYYKQCDPKVLSKRKKEEKIEPLYNKFAMPNGLDWRISKWTRIMR